MIKYKFPSLIQICGGNHVSLHPDELSSIPELDAICIGYGELPLLEFTEAVKKEVCFHEIKNLHVRQEGTIIKNPLRPFPMDIDPFIPCDRELFSKELQHFSFTYIHRELFGDNLQEFIFCRGCPYDCTYCSNHILRTLGSGEYIRYPSVSKCIEELVMLRKNLHMTGVAIHDDIFTLNKKWFTEFTKQYKRDVSLPYVCNLRVNCFSENEVKMLKSLDAN